MPEEIRRKRPLSVPKKLFFALLVTLLFFAVLEGVLAWMHVKPVLADRDPYVGFESSIPLFNERVEGGREHLETAPNKLQYFNPQRFSKKKQEGTRRLFCLGGSTTFGRPYNDSTSFSGWLRELLPRADSTTSWEVVNAGGISYASYRVANVLDELRGYEPDLFVIYTGHNEFLEERTYGEFLAQSGALRRLTSVLYRTRTYSLVSDWLQVDSAQQEDRDLLPAEVDTILDHAVGPEAYRRDPFLRQQILEHFEFNLSRMIEAAHDAGAQVILIKPASNLKDFSPFKSENLKTLDEPQWQRWKELYADAQRLQLAGESLKALELIAAAESLERGRAELHYLKGQTLLSLGRDTDARESFRIAVDQDICPLRALPEIQQTVEKVALIKKVPLVDFPQILKQDCLRKFGHVCPGNEYFLDHVHPTVETHRLLALAILQAMELQGLISPQEGWREQGIAAASQEIEDRLDWELQTKALKNLAQVLSWAGKQQEAGPVAIAAVEHRAEQGLDADPEAMFIAAVYLSSLGDTERAIALLEEVVNLLPRFLEARSRLATLLFDASRYPEARRHFLTCLEQDPSDTHCRDMLELIDTNEESG